MKQKISKRFQTPKTSISMDLDAYSVVIRTNNIGKATDALRRYLLAFGGSSPCKCGFPLMATGSRTKDGIFGCRDNSGQHLPPILQGKEMLVLDTPVKIALHMSCKHRLIDWLTSKDYFFKAASDLSGLCFDTKYMANKPPYCVLIEGIIACCSVVGEYSPFGESVHIVHVADIGFRLPLPNFLHLTTCILPMTDRNEPYIEVEIAQVDIAFSCKQEKSKLIQARCCTNPSIPNNSLLQGSSVNIFPIHTVPPLIGPTLRSEMLRGTIQLKKRKWDCGKNIIHLCDTEDDVTMVDNGHHNGVQEITDLFLTSKKEGISRDSISVISSSIYSLKAYSTIAHVLLQSRSKFPLTFKDMFGVGKRSIESLQSLVVNADKSQQQAFSVAKEQGLSFRIEVSIRPHSNDPLRKKGHFNDILLLACVAISEFCFLHKPVIALIPTISIETESMKLISEARDLLRTRQAIKFESRFKCQRATEWLRFHLSLMLITIGICPSFQAKYINQWLNNEHRFDPNDRAVSRQNDLERNSNSNRSDLKLSRLLKRTLSRLHFPNQVANDFESVLKNFLIDPKRIDCRKVYTDLNFKAKHMLAYNMWRDIIPTMLELNKLEDCNEDNANNMEDKDEDCILHYDGDWMPDTNPRWNDYTKDAPDHPLGLSLHFLSIMSNFWIHRRQAFNQTILSSFVLKCHESVILSHPEIKNVALMNILIQSSHGSKILTIKEMFQVCDELCGNSRTRGHKSEAYYLQILHECYNFPCSEKSFETEGNVKDTERNIILNQILRLDLVHTVSETIVTKKLDRYADNSCIDIPKSLHIFRLGSQSVFETCHKDNNLFLILKKSLNLKESSCIRQIVQDYLSTIVQNLEYMFLTENGTTNVPFQGMENWNVLVTKFPSLEVKSTAGVTSTLDMSVQDEFHQVMFAICSLVYESDITFHNSQSGITYFFATCHCRSVIYTHKTDQSHTDVLTESNSPNHTDVLTESNSPNHLIFQLGFDGTYNWIKILKHHHPSSGVNSISPLGGNVQKVSKLTLVSPGMKKGTSKTNFHESISKLLKAMDVNYMEDDDVNEDDNFGLRPFLNELSSSRHVPNRFQGFHKDVVLQCGTLGMSLRTVSSLLKDGDLKLMCHRFLCPIICLKYSNLTLGVIENVDGAKSTYFYAYNSLVKQVCCVKHKGICILTSRPETLYLYTNRTTWSYWYPSAMSNLRNEIKWWKHHKCIIGKYAYAGIRSFRRYLQSINDVYLLNIFWNIGNMKNFDFRPETPEKLILCIRLTINSGNIAYFSQWDVEHHAVVLIFPGINKMESWDACIVHHPDQDPSLVKKHLVDSILSFAPKTGTYLPHCIKGFSSGACDFGFFIILCAYIGSQCLNFHDYVTAINRLQGEGNLGAKSRLWMHNVVENEDSRKKTPSCHKTPYWIRQITWKDTENTTSELNSDPSHNSFCPDFESPQSITIGKENADSRFNFQVDPLSKDTENIMPKNSTMTSVSRRKKNKSPKESAKSQKKRKKESIPVEDGSLFQISIAIRFYLDSLLQQNSCKVIESRIRSTPGLKNPKNDCYINTIIQLLFGMKCTREYFLRMSFVTELKVESSEYFIQYLKKGGSVAFSLSMLFDRMNSERMGLSVKEFKDCLVRLNASYLCYDNNSQQDAHELLNKVFDSLSETFSAYHKHDPITLWFRSSQHGTILCSSCKWSPPKDVDDQFIIPLGICGETLESCLQFHLKSFIVGEYKCDRCSTIGCCERSFVLRTGPIVIFLLKRFSNTGGEKNSCNVKFPLKGFTISNHGSYDCAAIISHRGSGLISNGHYVISMRIGNDWIEFDDNKVSQLNVETNQDIQNKWWAEAYIVVYCRSDAFEELVSMNGEKYMLNINNLTL